MGDFPVTTDDQRTFLAVASDDRYRPMREQCCR
jgi:hypothetical protein